MVAMQSKNVALLLLLFAALVCLVGCAGGDTPTPAAVSEEPPAPTEKPSEEAPTVVVEETAEEVQVEPTEAAEAEPTESAEAEPTEEPEPEPTAEPTATPVVVVDVDSACVDCHTDKDRLAELAEEPEEVELSSGEG
jgi:hypothetical protein